MPTPATEPRTAHSLPARTQGFTLIELMIGLAVVAILAMLAYPSLIGYLNRNKVRAATSDLAALDLLVQNVYQQQLNYNLGAGNANCTAPLNSTAKVKACLTGFQPQQASAFAYGITYDNTTYTLSATGAGALSGCTLSLNQANSRTASGCPVSNW